MQNPPANPRYDPATGPVIPVFVRYAVPSVLGMLAVTSAGIIDGFFIGNYVGATALAAVNIAQPASVAFTGIVFMLAVGGSVVCSRFIGARNLPAASAIAEIAIFLILLTHWFSGKCTLRLSLSYGRWKDLAGTAWNGFSEFANELSVGLVILLFNWVMITRQGVEGVAAYTVIGYLMMVGLEITYGISESLQPTISRNLGAGKPERIRKFMLTGVSAAFLVGVLVSAVMLLYPEQLIGLFVRDGEQETIAIALVFVSFFWPAFLLNGSNITLASYFTALHRPLPSAAIALSRSFVLPGLGLLFLPRWLGNSGVYLAVPIAELITFALAIILVMRIKPPLLKTH